LGWDGDGDGEEGVVVVKGRALKGGTMVGEVKSGTGILGSFNGWGEAAGGLHYGPGYGFFAVLIRECKTKLRLRFEG
jgi:hypothetical protein